MSAFPSHRLESYKLTIQEIRRHQQLQTQLRWYFHIWHILLILMCLVVVEVLAHFLQNDTAVRIISLPSLHLNPGSMQMASKWQASGHPDSKLT